MICILMFVMMLFFRMVLCTRPIGSSGIGEGSGSGSGAEQLDDHTREFISSEITCNILDQTLVIFGMIKVGILEFFLMRD